MVGQPSNLECKTLTHFEAMLLKWSGLFHLAGAMLGSLCLRVSIIDAQDPQESCF